MKSVISNKEGHYYIMRNGHTDGQALDDRFSSFGPISEVVVLKDQETQQSWGFGFITFTHPQRASDATRIPVDHAGKTAQGTRGAALGAHGRGHSQSRGGGDLGYGSGRYDSGPEGYRYRYRRSRD
uniref:RRM domain-containing protein n=1 Tax=Equus asinus TaxID=9793 RepID=A0A9L0J209_EQUAS